jgi:hypothetical protein
MWPPPYSANGGSCWAQILVAYRQRGWKRHPDGGTIGPRHVTLEHDLRPAVRQVGVRDRDRGQQRLGVGVDGPHVELLGRRHLDDLAEVHDRDAVRHVPHHAQVVSDEDVGEVQLVLEVIEQVNHLRADRDVEGRDRLVGDDQLRVQGQRPGHADPLPLAAGELVRIAVDVLRRQADELEQFAHPALDLVPVPAPVDAQRVGEYLADPLTRVERRVRVLEYHLQLAPHRAQLSPGQRGDVLALEHHRSAGERVQPGQAPGQRGLAAPGLADQAERLPGAQLEADVVHRVHPRDLTLQQDPAPDREVLGHVLGPEQQFAVAVRGGGGGRSGGGGRGGGAVGGHSAFPISSGWIVVSRSSFFCLGSR